jgi:hypothetical protein
MVNDFPRLADFPRYETAELFRQSTKVAVNRVSAISEEDIAAFRAIVYGSPSEEQPKSESLPMPEHETADRIMNTLRLLHAIPDI